MSIGIVVGKTASSNLRQRNTSSMASIYAMGLLDNGTYRRAARADGGIFVMKNRHNLRLKGGQ